MAAGDLALGIVISATNMTGGVFGSLISSLKSMNPLMAGITAVGVAAGTAVVGFGVSSVKAASDFQSSMLKVQAYAGMTQQQTQQMGQAILQMAPQLGEAPKALADSLYFVASAGFKGAAGLTVLRYAGMTAAAGNVDATVTAAALVGSLNALGLSAKSAGNISDELNATVKNGVMTWPQYGAVVGKVASSVSSAGGSSKMMQSNFTDLNAALDVYTNSSVSARQASMWLSADMNVLFGKAGSLATNAQKLKLSFDANAYAGMNFAQRLQYLNQITDGNHQELVKLVGGNSTVANSISFLNNHYGSLSSTIASVSGSMQKGKTTQEMFATAQQGLGFQVAKAQAAFQSLQITVGTQLLPIITRLVASVTPVISNFAQWLTKSGALQNGLSALGNIFSTIANIVSGAIANWPILVSVLAGITAAVIAFNASAIVAAIVAIPGVVIGFGAWAIAAGAAAIATLAAAAPFILIGLVVAAVVLGIILAIQHWGAISAWLKSAWSGISAWFGNLFSQIGTFAHGVVTNIGNWFSGLGSNVRNILTNIKNFFGNIFSGLGTTAHNVINNIGGFFSGLGSHAHTAMDNTKNAFQTGWTNITNGAQQAANTVVGWFSWLYNHNYYVKALVDFITNTWKNGIAFWQGVWKNFTTWLANVWTTIKAGIQNVWNAITSWLGTAWNAIKTLATNVWTAVTTAIHTAIQTAWNWLVSVWTTISTWIGAKWQYITTLASMYWNMLVVIIQAKLAIAEAWIQTVWNRVITFLTGIWNTITTDVSKMWTAISSFFVNAWTTYIATPLSNLWNQITKWFGNLANQALTWGKNLIQGFVNGITGMLGAVGNAASQVAGKIAQFLGFHSPTELGPGSQAHTWAPNFISMYSAGLRAGIPKIQSAFNALLAPSIAMGSMAAAGSHSNAFALQGSNSNTFSLQGSNHTITIQMEGAPVYLDKKKVGDMVGQHFRRQISLQGGYRSM